jgi:hypothetical protein
MYELWIQVRCLLGLYLRGMSVTNIGDPIYYVTAPILEGLQLE